MTAPTAARGELPLVGRDDEVERIDHALRTLDAGARFLVLRGEAGIGKTALWRTGVERHRLAGHRALVARAAEDELPGPISALIDLFDGVEVDVPLLAPDTDPYARARALLSTLRRLAAQGPLLVALDDVQWLDPASARVLAHALRRLDREPVLVLATERTGDRSAPRHGPLPTDRREEVAVGPLSLDATRHLLATAGAALPRPRLERVHELSGGNPLFALELARATTAGADPGAGVPPTLRELLADRIAAVPDDELAVLRVAAALGPAPVDATARACVGGADPRSSLAAAVDRGVLHLGDDLQVRFAHPLLAALVLTDLHPFARQELHARLARVVDDPDARARHLALSSAEADEAVAAELEAAATRAARRGASRVAADLADHAVRVTPPADLPQRVRRAFVAILHRAAAGERDRAIADSDQLIALLPPGPGRAAAITTRVALDFADGDRFLGQALAEAGGDDALRSRILELRGWMATTYRAEPARGLALGEEALDLARRLDDPAVEMLAASSVAVAARLLGRPRPDLMARAMALAAAHEGPRLGRWPQSARARECLWCGQLAESRALMEALHAEFVRSGMEFQRPYRLLDLAELEVAAGRLPAAARLAADGIEAATDARNTQARAWLGYPAGLAAAHAGDDAGVAAALALLRSHPDDPDGGTRTLMAGAVAGLHALGRGEPAAALGQLLAVVERLRHEGVRLPSVIPALPDAIEAAAATGEVALSAALADELDGLAGAPDQPWVDAAAARGRGLAALAEGREEAADLLAAAADRFDELGYGVDAARARLHQGRALLRTGHRRAAADALTDARARAAAMGAGAWRRRAEAELDRAAPGREPAALTATERRIAGLVAAGRRNREIAGELYVSVATVEAHLTRIYRKLAVRSRTELARVLAADVGGGGAGTRPPPPGPEV